MSEPQTPYAAALPSHALAGQELPARIGAFDVRENEDEGDTLAALLSDMEERGAYWTGFRYPPDAGSEIADFAGRLRRLLSARSTPAPPSAA